MPFLIFLTFFYLNTEVSSLRETPSRQAEIVTTSYYSEEVNVLAEEGDWYKIETLVDHYQGWIEKEKVLAREQKFVPKVKVQRKAAHVYTVEDTVYGPLLTLPFESKLEVTEETATNSRWIPVVLLDGTKAFIQRGDVSFEEAPLSLTQLKEFSLEFLGLPYTWGGRSSFGYDCSGFTQMLYRQMGIFLPRDAKDQIKWEGFKTVSLNNLQVGDLLFFGLAEDKIRHVGLSLGKDLFIHATVAENKPYIRISSLSEKEWDGSSRFKFSAAKTLK